MQAFRERCVAQVARCIVCREDDARLDAALAMVTAELLTILEGA